MTSSTAVMTPETKTEAASTKVQQTGWHFIRFQPVVPARCCPPVIEQPGDFL